MKSPVLLPYLFKRYGKHNMVRLVDPDRLDLSQPFFYFARSGDAASERMVGFDEWLAAQPEPEADYSDFAGIFHVSRCGSTLLARNIAESGQALVLSEPPFFRILRHRMGETVSADVALRASLALITAWRRWAQTRASMLVVKFNSQLHGFLPELLAGMPGARFVFLHREPLAVFESHDRKPPLYLQHLGGTKRTKAPDYLAKVAAEPMLRAAATAYCTALDRFADVKRDRVLPIAYPQLGTRYAEILRHFRLDPAAAPPWSAERDAKATVADGTRPYVAVTDERLQSFKSDNLALLDIARERYANYLAASKSAV